MNYTIWDGIFFVGFAVYICIRGHFEKRTKQNIVATSAGSSSDLCLFILVMIGCMLLPAIYLVSPFLNFANYKLPTIVPFFGTAVMTLALWLFWRSHADLGLNWSVKIELRQQHNLVTHGVYKRIRHPMYTAIFLVGVAQAMLIENWLAGWSALVSFGIMYLVRTPREERMMLQHFGDEYRAYMQRTGRLLPRFF